MSKNLPILNRTSSPQYYTWGPYVIRPSRIRKKTWILEDNGQGDETYKEFRLLSQVREYIAEKHL